VVSQIAVASRSKVGQGVVAATASGRQQPGSNACYRFGGPHKVKDCTTRHLVQMDLGSPGAFGVEASSTTSAAARRQLQLSVRRIFWWEVQTGAAYLPQWKSSKPGLPRGATFSQERVAERCVCTGWQVGPVESGWQ